MSIALKIASYFWDIPVEKTSSEVNDYLEVVWSQGRKVLNTKSANFSFGNGYKVFEKAISTIKEEVERAAHVLVLGFGCGSILDILQTKYNYNNQLTGIEYDKEIIRLFETHFNDGYSLDLDLIEGDAFEYVSTCKSKFDIIFIDLFSELDNVPFVFNQTFILNLVKAINNGGTLVFNCTQQNASDKQKISELMIKLTSNFKEVQKIPFQELNQIIIAK